MKWKVIVYRQDVQTEWLALNAFNVLVHTTSEFLINYVVIHILSCLKRKIVRLMIETEMYLFVGFSNNSPISPKIIAASAEMQLNEISVRTYA